MFRDILVAIDGSPTAQRALEAAAELAEALNSRLTIIAVAPEVPPFAYRSGIEAKERGRDRCGRGARLAS